MRFNILAIFAAALLYALANAAPLSPSFHTFSTVGQAVVCLYRGGNAKTPINKMREQDWKIKDGHVHPSDDKGLSTNMDPKNLGPSLSSWTTLKITHNSRPSMMGWQRVMLFWHTMVHLLLSIMCTRQYKISLGSMKAKSSEYCGKCITFGLEKRLTIISICH